MRLDPESVMASPEKAALVDAIERAIVARTIERWTDASVDPAVSTITIGEMIDADNWGSVPRPDEAGPGEPIRMTPGEAETLRALIARAIRTVGGFFRRDNFTWKSIDGKTFRLIRDDEPETKRRPMTDLLTAKRTLTFNRMALIEGIAAVSPAVPARTPKEILMNVLLDIDPEAGAATLMATDLEHGIRHFVGKVGPGEPIAADEPIRLVLPLVRVRSILAAAEGDETVQIVVEGEHGRQPEKMRLRGSRFKFDIPLENPDLFPAVPEFGDDVPDYAVVAAADLRKAIHRSVFACDEESRRYALGGCLFEFGADHLVVVATDGRRLSRQVVPMEVEGAGYAVKAGEQGPVVPVKPLKLILRVTQDQDYPIHIARPSGADGMMFRTERSTISTRLVEGRYPRYDQILPDDHKTYVTTTAGSLAIAVNQAANATSEESRTVEFDFRGGVLTLRAQAANVGQGEVELDVAQDGPDASVALDPHYVSDVLKTLAGETELRIAVEHGKLAVVIRTDDQFQHAVMPITKEQR